MRHSCNFVGIFRFCTNSEGNKKAKKRGIKINQTDEEYTTISKH
jgi:hypothetical protein